MIDSEKQLEIYRTWREDGVNILINAVAGSGKTTTLLSLIESCEHRVLYLAFNKNIQEETQVKLEERGLKQGLAMTTHAVGYAAIRNAYQKVYIEKGKNYFLFNSLALLHPEIFGIFTWKEKFKYMYALMSMNDASRLFLTNDYLEVEEHLLGMNSYLPQTDVMKTLWALFVEFRDEYNSKPAIKIDFIDMIYLPAVKEMYIPFRATYLMIDECQDLNLCQHKIVDLLLSQGDVEKWIAVGDQNQAIYGFAGASTESFDLFLERPNVVALPLDICYRSAKSIVDSANEVFPVMESFKTHPGIVEIIDYPEQIKEGSMVICRNTGPIFKLYFTLLGLNKPCFIKGEDILQGILKFLKPYKSKRIDTAVREMKYKEEELSHGQSDELQIAYYVYKENFSNFSELAKNLGEDYETIESLIDKIENCFIDQDGAILLCTIHKAKGLESDVVYILNEHLIPSKFAKNTEQLTQEQNLKYVARTRAKEELYFLTIK